MTRAVDNFSKFLTVVQQPSDEGGSSSAPAQRSAPTGNATQQVLRTVLAFPDGIDLSQLYKQTALDFSVFAEALDRLKKLGGVRVDKGSNGETAYPGPNSREVESLIS